MLRNKRNNDLDLLQRIFYIYFLIEEKLMILIEIVRIHNNLLTAWSGGLSYYWVMMSGKNCCN